MTDALIHITSFILLVQPECAESVMQRIAEHNFFKIALRDLALGKLILIVESSSLPGIEHEISQLYDLHGVQAVTLVYHHAATLEELQAPIL